MVELSVSKALRRRESSFRWILEGLEVLVLYVDEEGGEAATLTCWLEWAVP